MVKNKINKIFKSVVSIKEFWLIVALLIFITFLSFASPYFLTSDNLLNIFRQISIIAIIAVGGTFVIVSRGLDLSVGSLVALTGVIIAILIKANVNIVVALIIGLIAATFVGFINGLIISKIGISPIITTLAMLMILRGVSLVISGGRSIYDLPNAFGYIGKGYWGPIPIPVVIVFLIYILFHFLLTRTVFGRYIKAIGGNEQAANTAGINYQKIRLIVYTLAGFLTGLSGIILASRLQSGQPAAGEGLEISVIAAVLLGGASLQGGAASLLGTALGALIIGIIQNGLNLLNVSPFYQSIVKGAVILIAVLIDRVRAVKAGS